MKFRLIVVGRPRDQGLAAAIGAFETRAARYWPLEVVALRGEPSRAVSASEARRREGERIAAHLRAPTLVACDERGERLASIPFAGWLQQLRERAADVDLVIGGAHGLDDAIRARAARLLALAPWTLSHELARLVLAEQLYRAGTILRGEPYHK
jgi:23S rRNA (pseudouridine1915-N3)-methyltransferase